MVGKDIDSLGKDADSLSLSRQKQVFFDSLSLRQKRQVEHEVEHEVGHDDVAEGDSLGRQRQAEHEVGHDDVAEGDSLGRQRQVEHEVEHDDMGEDVDSLGRHADQDHVYQGITSHDVDRVMHYTVIGSVENVTVVDG